MIDEANAILSAAILLLAGGMWPLGFMFGMCSACCDTCPWLLEFDRCLRVSFVGTDPPAGGDCRIISSRAGSGDVQYMTSSAFQIHNVPSRVTIPIRVNLTATGSNRTPVGETRTQVWRFTRPAPTSPAAAVYDVLGPEWHLQVDLSVTGVETQEEAEVTASIGQDEHGQPKLILQMKQWTATIESITPVTLFPVGLQRWAPGLTGTQSFRLQASGVNATRVSGDSYTGWTVQTSAAASIEERRIAVRFSGSICDTGSPSTAQTVSQRIILDDGVAVDFLNGDEDIRVGVTGGALRDLRVMPNSALCEASRLLVGTGVAAGIYPETIGAAISPDECEGTLSFTLKPDPPLAPLPSACAGLWGSATYVRPRSTQLNLISGAIAVPDDFWAGRSLLWNLEHGPYRNSFTTEGGGRTTTLTLGGSGAADAFYLSPNASPACPDGFVEGNGPFCASSPIVIPLNHTVELRIYEAFANECPSPVSDSASVTLSSDSNSGVRFTPFFQPSDVFRKFAGAPPAPAPVIVYGGFGFGEPVEVDFGGFGQVTLLDYSATCYGYVALDHCGIPYQQTLTARCLARVSLTDPQLPGGIGGLIILSPESIAAYCAGDSSNPDNYPSGLDFEIEGITVELKDTFRKVCGEWSSSVADAAGESVSRECEITNREQTISTYTETFDIPASRSRFAKSLGFFSDPNVGTISQLGRCRLLGLRDLNATSQTSISLQHSSSPAAGQCLSYLPLFGETAGTLCTGDLSNNTSMPCDGCTPVVSIVSGEENASVQYISGGDRAGVIQVVARRTWLGGEGVEFTVACGNDEITQVIQRPPTPPSAPRNLIATGRGPCSEISLAWEAPEHDGGQPITTYTIQFRRIGGSFATFGTVAPPALSATVTGLLRLGYEFRVSATNSVGTSGFSNVAADGFALAAPTGLAAAPRSPCSEVSLSWTPPAQSECIVVVEYQVQFRVAGTGSYQTFATVAGTQTAATVTGLNPATSYQFRVNRVDDASTVVASSIITVDGCPPE